MHGIKNRSNIFVNFQMRPTPQLPEIPASEQSSTHGSTAGEGDPGEVVGATSTVPPKAHPSYPHLRGPLPLPPPRKKLTSASPMIFLLPTVATHQGWLERRTSMKPTRHHHRCRMRLAPTSIKKKKKEEVEESINAFPI